MDFTYDPRMLSDLNRGERILWMGKPIQGLKLRASDALLIPFSLLWGGFAIFWEGSVLNSKAPIIFDFWGIPFVLIGIYLIAGRFFWDAFVRAKTTYVVTNQRLVVIGPRTRKSSSLTSLPQLTLTEQANGQGSIEFGAAVPYGRWGGSPWNPSSSGTRFEFIDGAASVYAMIGKARLALADRS